MFTYNFLEFHTVRLSGSFLSEAPSRGVRPSCFCGFCRRRASLIVRTRVDGECAFGKMFGGRIPCAAVRCSKDKNAASPMRKANASSGGDRAAVGGRYALDVSGCGNRRADFFWPCPASRALLTPWRLLYDFFFLSLFFSFPNACWGCARRASALFIYTRSSRYVTSCTVRATGTRGRAQRKQI